LVKQASVPESSQPSLENTPAPLKASEQILPPSDLPSPEEAANDPLVKAVLDTFEGTVKQVYPRK